MLTMVARPARGILTHFVLRWLLGIQLVSTNRPKEQPTRQQHWSVGIIILISIYNMSLQAFAQSTQTECQEPSSIQKHRSQVISRKQLRKGESMKLQHDRSPTMPSQSVLHKSDDNYLQYLLPKTKNSKSISQTIRRHVVYNKFLVKYYQTTYLTVC